MTKSEQNRVVAWRLKILREADDVPRGVVKIYDVCNQKSAISFVDVVERSEIEPGRADARGAVSRI